MKISINTSDVSHASNGFDTKRMIGLRDSPDQPSWFHPMASADVMMVVPIRAKADRAWLRRSSA
jgi:hypothetical protein